MKTTKICVTCKQEVDSGDFRRTTRNGKRYYVKVCSSCRPPNPEFLLAPEREREKRRREHTQRRKAQLKHKYGITPEEYEWLYQSQNGICAIEVCDQPATKIDHSHLFGHVRGLLCHKCNIMLHGFEEIGWRNAAIKYLDERNLHVFQEIR